MSSNNGRGETSPYFRRLMREIFDPTPEEIEARAREFRRATLPTLIAADLPLYPTKKGLHLIRRALPEVPLCVGRAQKGGGK